MKKLWKLLYAVTFSAAVVLGGAACSWNRSDGMTACSGDFNEDDKVGFTECTSTDGVGEHALLEAITQGNQDYCDGSWGMAMEIIFENSGTNPGGGGEEQMVWAEQGYQCV